MKIVKRIINSCLALGVLTLISSCSSDSPDDVLDTSETSVTLASSYEMDDTSPIIRLKGEVVDEDGIVAVDFTCPELQIESRLDLLNLFSKPQKLYRVNHTITLPLGVDGEEFMIDVKVTDKGGHEHHESIPVSLSGDFMAPEFTEAPEAENAVILNNSSKFNLKFTAKDDRSIDYVTLDIQDITEGETSATSLDGFPRRIEGNGTATLAFEEELTLPNKSATYIGTITAYDKAVNDEAHSTSVTFRISVADLPDYDKLYLCDVASEDDLKKDVFGVPMLIEHVGAFKYRARYYNEKAGTEIFFIGQKESFSPVCFGPSKSNSNKLGSSSDQIGRLRLDVAGVYYLIEFDTANRTYEVSTYAVNKAISPIMHMNYGGDDLNTWSDKWDASGIWWQKFYFGPATSPGDVMEMKQDANNPHIYTLENWNLEGGKNMNFMIHNWHSNGWWNYVTWRVDNAEDPEVFAYYGMLLPDTDHFKGNADYFQYKYGNQASFDINKWSDENYRKTFVPDIWASPLVKTGGSYKLIFDAHLERARLVPQS